MPKKKEKEEEVISKEAYVEVTVQATKVGEEEVKSRRIRVRPFITQPATVSVNAGATINLGNFESGRINVMLSMPCYKEEVAEVFEDVKEWVDVRLKKEVDELRGGR